jgi:hypothetical protein
VAAVDWVESVPPRLEGEQASAVVASAAATTSFNRFT